MMSSHRIAATISRRRFLVYSAALAGYASLPPAAANASTDDLAFLVVGDWGMPDRKDNAKRVADRMGDAARRLNARFVLSTGDNFYSRGVSDVDDTQWRTSFEQVFTARSLTCPWYVVLGNHDHRGNIAAEIAYSDSSARWRMPARYYSRSEPLPAGGAADFFFLDTEPFATSTDVLHRFWPFDTIVEEQLAWLEKRLSASSAVWKIVIGHHPVFSGGKHGNTPALVDRVKPLLDRFGVQAYINGHDHDLQHIVVDNVSYITCGAACQAKSTGAIAGTLFSASRLGFMAAEISREAFAISFLDDQGQSLYSATIAQGLSR